MGYPIYHSAYTAAQIEAAIGKGPRVNASGYWEVWNVGTGDYESTGVGAGVTPPTVVTQVSQMTNHGYVYIYNGTETGYTAGYWYYWDGSTWTAGGAYQVAATDTTLSVVGAAADAKATGDAVNEIKSAFKFQTSSKIDVSQGYWAIANGTPANSANWCKSDFLNRDAILTTHSIAMVLLAYDLTGTYIGTWNGSSFVTSYNSNELRKEIIVREWLEKYPSYRFRVDYFNYDAALTPATVLSDIEVEYYSDNEIEFAKKAVMMQDDPLHIYAAGTGYGINFSNGNTSSDAALSYSNYINISDYEILLYKRLKSTSSNPVTGIAFYNASKSYVSGMQSIKDQAAAGYDSELAGVKIPDNAVYVRFSMFTDTETYGAFAAYGTVKICNEVENIKSNIVVLAENNRLNYKNLAGLEGNVYYPVNISPGTSVVMSTADGQALGQSGLALFFYDEDYNELTYWSFSQNSSYRVVTAPGDVPTRYLKWDSTPIKAVQVEIGYAKTEYVPYNYPVGPIIEKLTDGSTFNGEMYNGSYDWQSPVVAYGALFNGVSNVETFGFFTDPHVMGFTGRNEPNMQDYIKKVSRVFRSAPCRNYICGGDWLNNDTLADEACYRLGYIKALAKNMLCDCKLVVGNHDTNYQGKADAESERGTGALTNDTIAALMFNDTETKKAYYSFEGTRSKCYVLDTGIEHSDMQAYDWEQVAWLAGKLTEDDAAHSIIFLHIITNNGNVQTNTSNFASLVQAYNGHTTVTLNSITYDFTACAGKVELWVGGHTHADSNGTLGGIPYIITASLSYNSAVPLIDLMLVDYDNHVLKTIRVGGTGSNRTISLAT